MNLSTFDFNLLRVFEAVHRTNSVSRAAEVLRLSQPAVSNALNRLRRQFNDPLFVRTSRGMSATPKAERLARAIGEGLTVIRAGLLSDTDFDPSLSDRRFTLLMTDIGEIIFLPMLLAELACSAPNVTVHVREAALANAGELLESGAADLAIGRLRFPPPMCDQCIHSSSFAVVAGIACTHLQSQPDGSRSISYEAYLAAPHILVEQGGIGRNLVREALGGDGGRLRIALTVPHTTILPMIMPKTDLVATVPLACVPHLLAAGGLTATSIPFEVEPVRVYQSWHRRNSSDPGHVWLRGKLSEVGLSSSDCAAQVHHQHG